MTQDLTSGSLKRALILFALPLFFSQLFQTLYNTADTVIIGYTLGSQSLAAVGSVAALFELIVGFCTGFGQGLGIVAAQKYGGQDLPGYRRSLALSVLLSAAVSLAVSMFFVAGMDSVLSLLQTPPDLFEEAERYISIIAFGLIITMFYNLCAAFLRAAGDSTTPLIILLISSVINILLDFVFICWFGMGVEGTAWATLAAQLISLLFCILWIALKKKELVPSWKEYAWQGSMVLRLLKMGFSMALMSSIVSLGTLVLQTGINQMGMQKIAGHTAARKLIAILNLPVGALMMALSSFVAQNTGAGQLERVEKGVAFANRLGLIYGAILSAVTVFASGAFIALISGSSDAAVIDTGSLYLLTNIPFFPVLAILLNLRTSLQSMSLTAVPIFSSVIELIGKVLFTCLVVPSAGYYGICAVEPAVWSAMALFLSWFYLRVPMFRRKGIRVHLFR